MALLIAFAVFMIAMVLCLVLGYSMLFALMIGLISFIIVGKTKGFILKDLLLMAAGGVKDSLVVIEVVFMIGFITALWRSAGTITFFVYYGVKLVTPSLFVLIAFLISCLLSYALGSSFGVAGTLGVIFMALARSGGVDPLVAAGAIMSGVYFGDRCSPASSSAILVANVSKTELLDNVKLMLKTGIIPVGICVIIYTVLSVMNPMNAVDASVMETLQADFRISPITVIPALFILILPLLKVDIRWAFLGSIISSFLITVLLQELNVVTTLKYCISGFTATSESLKPILSGGGALSMVEVCVILVISCSYSGIFKGTDMLEDLQARINKIINRTGRYLTMMATGIITSAVFCNQTIASMMCSDLLTKPYLDTGGSRSEMAIDIENSTIVLAGVVPWAIACTVPFGMMGVGIEAIPYSCLLYIIPISYIFTKRIWFKDSVEKIEK